MNTLKKIIIRWAIKQIRKNVIPTMNYSELESWGVQDIMKSPNGSNEFII
jgi:hypothetical protein